MLMTYFKKTSILLSASICILVFMLPMQANAAQNQGMRCNISVRSNLNFGVYMPLTPVDVNSTGRIRVTCRRGYGTFSIQIGPGVSGNQASRALAHTTTSELLYYNVYLDAGHSQIWGDGTPPTFMATGVRSFFDGRRTRIFYTIYGSLFANQAPNPGNYRDSLYINVLF